MLTEGANIAIPMLVVIGATSSVMLGRELTRGWLEIKAWRQRKRRAKERERHNRGKDDKG